MSSRWEKALYKKNNNKRLTLSEYVCFMIGYGYASAYYYEFMDFVKKYRKNYARAYKDWEVLRNDWHTFRVLDQYRYNV